MICVQKSVGWPVYFTVVDALQLLECSMFRVFCYASPTSGGCIATIGTFHVPWQIHPSGSLAILWLSASSPYLFSWLTKSFFQVIFSFCSLRLRDTHLSVFIMCGQIAKHQNSVMIAKKKLFAHIIFCSQIKPTSPYSQLPSLPKATESPPPTPSQTFNLPTSCPPSVFSPQPWIGRAGKLKSCKQTFFSKGPSQT